MLGFAAAFGRGYHCMLLINTIKSNVGTDAHIPVLHLNTIPSRPLNLPLLSLFFFFSHGEEQEELLSARAGLRISNASCWSSEALPCSEPCNFYLAVAPLLELLRVAGGSCRQQEGSSCHIPLPNGVSYRALL